MKREKKYYVIKVNKEHRRITEKTLLNCLIDRYNICSLEKLIKLHNDEKYIYFIIYGNEHACRSVISIARNNLKPKNIILKANYYDVIRNNFTDELLWTLTSNQENSAGVIIQDYKNPIYINYIKKLTTKFVLKNSLMSRYTFCSECDGVGEHIELSSLKGVYKCPLCDCEMNVEGPIITGKKNVTHLSIEEQEVLKDMLTKLDNNSLFNAFEGEQIGIILNEPIDITPIVKVKRRRNKLFSLLSLQQPIIQPIEQISWDIL